MPIRQFLCRVHGRLHLRHRGAALVLLAFVAVLILPVPSSFGLEPAEIYQRYGAAVVTIIGSRSQGTGFVIPPDGLIVTNHHVVEDQASLEIQTQTKRRLPVGRIVRQDPDRDLAVLDADTSGLPRIPLGDSRAVKVGERVVAIGAPLGLADSLSVGYVSQIRTIDGITHLQTTTPVSPGNSGGPLINDRGEVVGVIRLALPPAWRAQNLNFAVAINELDHLFNRVLPRQMPTKPPAVQMAPPPSSGTSWWLFALPVLATIAVWALRAFRRSIHGQGAIDLSTPVPPASGASRPPAGSQAEPAQTAPAEPPRDVSRPLVEVTLDVDRARWEDRRLAAQQARAQRAASTASASAAPIPIVRRSRPIFRLKLALVGCASVVLLTLAVVYSIQRYAGHVPSSPQADPITVARAAAQGKEWGRATAAYREAVRLEPGNAAAWKELGNALAAQGQYENAVTAYREALRLEPNNGPAWNALGAAHTRQHQYAEATEAFQTAARLQPTNAHAWTGLGAALAARGQLEEAIPALREAVRLDPNLGEAWANLGLVCLQQTHYAETIDALRKAVDLEPGNAKAWVGLGTAYTHQGQPSEAITALRKAVELQPDLADAWASLGLLLWGQDRDGEALTALRNAVRLQPTSAATRAALGFACISQGLYVEAIPALREAVRLQPTLAAAWADLGYAYLGYAHFFNKKLGETVKALDQSIGAFQEAVRLRPDDERAWTGLGSAYVLRDNQRGVREAYERLKVLNPSKAEKLFGWAVRQ